MTGTLQGIGGVERLKCTLRTRCVAAEASNAHCRTGGVVAAGAAVGP